MSSATARGWSAWTGSTSRRRSSSGSAAPTARARSTRSTAPATSRCCGGCATNTDDVVYAPEFRREIEEPVNAAVAVPRDVPLVITEGNYLLVDDGPWAHVRDLLDETWYVVQDERDAAAAPDRAPRRVRQGARTSRASG